jgi:protease-4
LLNFIRNLVLNLFFILLVLVGVGLWMQFSDSKAEHASRGALLMDITGVVVDKPSASNRLGALGRQFFGASSDRLQENSLFDIVDTIRQAQSDRNITGIVLDLKNFAGADQPSMQYIGKALREFRDSGKPVYAVGDNYSQGSITSRASPIKFGSRRKGWLICMASPPTACITNPCSTS